MLRRGMSNRDRDGDRQSQPLATGGPRVPDGDAAAGDGGPAHRAAGGRSGTDCVLSESASTPDTEPTRCCCTARRSSAGDRATVSCVVPGVLNLDTCRQMISSWYVNYKLCTGTDIELQ